MRVMIAVLCLGLTAGCALIPTRRTSDPDVLTKALTNADVQWNGNILGLQPTITGSAARQLLALGKQASPSLRKALTDQSKFAAAHVLLTQIEKKEFHLSASHWNNLKVDLHADGTVDLHPEQIEKIKAMWKEELSGS